MPVKLHAHYSWPLKHDKLACLSQKSKNWNLKQSFECPCSTAKTSVISFWGDAFSKNICPPPFFLPTETHVRLKQNQHEQNKAHTKPPKQQGRNLTRPWRYHPAHHHHLPALLEWWGSLPCKGILWKPITKKSCLCKSPTTSYAKNLPKNFPKNLAKKKKKRHLRSPSEAQSLPPTSTDFPKTAAANRYALLSLAKDVKLQELLDAFRKKKKKKTRQKPTGFLVFCESREAFKKKTAVFLFESVSREYRDRRVMSLLVYPCDNQVGWPNIPNQVPNSFCIPGNTPKNLQNREQ